MRRPSTGCRFKNLKICKGLKACVEGGEEWVMYGEDEDEIGKSTLVVYMYSAVGGKSWL